MEKKSRRSVSLTFAGTFAVIAILIGSMLIGGDHTFAAGTSGADASPGFFQHYFVQPLTFVLDTVANWFSGNYGMSIIIVTLLLRLIIMPLMLRSSKTQMVMKDKMALIQPEMKIIQEKMKTATSQEQKMKLQQELMMLYKKHDVNPMASLGGCLPLLIQMPILMGFYWAIKNSPEIAGHSFLWFNLGSTDILLALLAGAVYFVQFKMSLIGMAEEQKKQMAIMGYISPIMMMFVSFNAPAALPLYWVVGGIFLMFQTYLSRKLYSSKTVPVKEVKTT
ncbi:membrane protein insertase YidC [Bacillus testis]|uniref:membrane protein insertase YidC n=1 Tax=Bacillus testis TaxID=1622072 RepID=UPI0009E2365A|nr:membrane protein insertase YidC [Bacillus testis]